MNAAIDQQCEFYQNNLEKVEAKINKNIRG
jgi:hypothetical protein